MPRAGEACVFDETGEDADSARSTATRVWNERSRPPERPFSRCSYDVGIIVIGNVYRTRILALVSYAAPNVCPQCRYKKVHRCSFTFFNPGRLARRAGSAARPHPPVPCLALRFFTSASNSERPFFVARWCRMREYGACVAETCYREMIPSSVWQAPTQ